MGRESSTWIFVQRLPRVCSYATIVTWWSGPGGIQALSERPTCFLQCFDTVGLVI